LTACSFLPEAEVYIGDGDGQDGTSEVEVEATEVVEVEAAKVGVAEAEAVEAEGCIGGSGMHWRWTELMELSELMELAVNTKYRRR
jgi:hypothetical protein